MKRGFTLVELLVVISIISVLAAIGIVNLNSARIKGRDSRRRADLATLQQSLESYYEESRSYPSNLTALTPTYTPSIPTDPRSRTTYGYQIEADAQRYALIAGLEQKAEAATIDVDTSYGRVFCAIAASPRNNIFVSGSCADGAGNKYFQVSSGG